MVVRPSSVPTGIISASKHNSNSLWAQLRSGWPRRPKRSRPNKPRWRSPRPRGMADVWSSVRASCYLGPGRPAGRSRLPQADDHDDTHAVSGEYVAGLSGGAAGHVVHTGKFGAGVEPAV